MCPQRACTRKEGSAKFATAGNPDVSAATELTRIDAPQSLLGQRLCLLHAAREEAMRARRCARSRTRGTLHDERQTKCRREIGLRSTRGAKTDKETHQSARRGTGVSAAASRTPTSRVVRFGANNRHLSDDRAERRFLYLPGLATSVILGLPTWNSNLRPGASGMPRPKAMQILLRHHPLPRNLNPHLIVVVRTPGCASTAAWRVQAAMPAHAASRRPSMGGWHPRGQEDCKSCKDVDREESESACGQWPRSAV